MKNRTLQMKKGMRTALLVLLLGVVGTTKMYAYDFSAVCETGQTLYYNITDATNHYVRLTYPGNSSSSPWEGFTKPSGNIVLPETVQYNSVTYIVTSINVRTFYYCSDLTGNLTIPNSVTVINGLAFSGCSGFTGNLSIGNSVTTIGIMAFSGCSGFTGNLSIGNSVATIGDFAFNGCSGFTGSLTIPNSVTAIGDYAFSSCYGFTGNLIIPNSVTSIGDSAFGSCSGFTGNLVIPNSVTSIGNGAFNQCIGLSGNLTIPNSVTSIGTNPFASCWGLEHIAVALDNPVYDSRNNCNAIIETNTNSLISGCKNSTIPNTVTMIGNYAFDRCGLGGSLTIPNSVTIISDYAFDYCWLLTSLTIPNSVTTIGNYAFHGCSGLTSMSVLAETPPSIGAYAFSQVDSAIPITVPCGCIPVYEASDWHDYFTTIIEDCTNLSEDGEEFITVFPNPTNGQITIEAEDLKHITISNMLGQTIYESKASGNEFVYDFGKHGAGLYLIRIETANGEKFVQKVIISK